MGNVVSFRKQRVDVVQEEQETVRLWVCACGGQMFELHEDGSVVCGQCKQCSIEMGCFNRTVPPPSA